MFVLIHSRTPFDDPSKSLYRTTNSFNWRTPRNDMMITNNSTRCCQRQITNNAGIVNRGYSLRGLLNLCYNRPWDRNFSLMVPPSSLPQQQQPHLYVQMHFGFLNPKNRLFLKIMWKCVGDFWRTCGRGWSTDRISLNWFGRLFLARRRGTIQIVLLSSWCVSRCSMERYLRRHWFDLISSFLKISWTCSLSKL